MPVHNVIYYLGNNRLFCCWVCCLGNSLMVKWSTVSPGIPHGSILRPLFVPGLHQWHALSSTCKLFADVVFYLKKSTVSEMKKCDLNCLFFWSQQWYLPLNISKCKVIRITNKSSHLPFTYNLNNSQQHFGLGRYFQVPWSQYRSQSQLACSTQPLWRHNYQSF